MIIRKRVCRYSLLYVSIEKFLILDTEMCRPTHEYEHHQLEKEAHHHRHHRDDNTVAASRPQTF